jgi:hypothetical protein
MSFDQVTGGLPSLTKCTMTVAEAGDRDAVETPELKRKAVLREVRAVNSASGEPGPREMLTN